MEKLEQQQEQYLNKIDQEIQELQRQLKMDESSQPEKPPKQKKTQTKPKINFKRDENKYDYQEIQRQQMAEKQLKEKKQKQRQLEPQIDEKWRIANMDKPNMDAFFQNDQQPVYIDFSEREDFIKLVKEFDEEIDQILKQDFTHQMNEEIFFGEN